MVNQHSSIYQGPGQNNAMSPLTPRDIVHKQIADFHYHVTEEDLERMVVSDQLSSRQKTFSTGHSNLFAERTGNTSYEVLDHV